jgi:hypothetical protein
LFNPLRPRASIWPWSVSNRIVTFLTPAECRVFEVMSLLPRRHLGVIILMQVSMGPLKQYLETMTRTLLRSRRTLAVTVLLLLASVAVLSTATRRPCLKVSSTSWHVWKSGYMTRSNAVEAAKLRISHFARAPRVAPLESVLRFEPFRAVPQKPPLPPNLHLVEALYFRPPPARG